MLIFNSRKFAANNAELVGTLFKSGGTAHGTYKTGKRGTTLYRLNGTPFAYIVHNPAQGYFAVSAGELPDGRNFYMHGLCSLDEKYIGFDTVPHGAQSELIRATFGA